MTPSAFLFDLDGTVYTEAGVVPGVPEAVARVAARGIPFRFVTNTTRRSRRALVERLRGYGIPAEPGDVFTSVRAAAGVLRLRGVRRAAAFFAREAWEDVEGLELIPPDSAGSPPVDAVVVGDLGDGWTAGLLNAAFRWLAGGAQLVALQKDRYWMTAGGLALDAGPYVAALEYATGLTALVCGKPSPQFYEMAVASLGRPPRVAMVGDDLWADIEGAQRAGLEGWLVRTGKYVPAAAAASGIRPDRELQSLADV